MESKSNSPARLPYINNPGLIALTIVINVACVLVSFGFRKRITQDDFLINIFFCGVITTIINTVYARNRIGKMRMEGLLPDVVPTPRLIRLLPKNNALLAAVLGVFFGLASVGVNWLLIRFYNITGYTLPRIVVWQAIFACALSSLIMQTLVLRLVQPDCAKPGEPEQNGKVQVLNPLPRWDTLKNWFDTVTSDFGFNMTMGLAFGGVVVIEQNVVIYPTALSGIAISSSILSIIVLLRMVLPVIKSIAALRENGELPISDTSSRFWARLPMSPAKFTLVLALPVILITYGALKGFLTLFDFQSLHFFQYFIIRTAYVAVLTKIIVGVSIARYTQPSAPGKTRGEAA